MACTVPGVFSYLRDLRVIILVLVCAVGGFVAATLIFQPPTEYHPDWGDFPTWLAFIAAAVAGGIALRQLRDQQGELRRQAQQLDRQQADKVVFDFWRPQSVWVFGGPGAPATISHLVTLSVDNGSGRPIRNVTCRIARGDALLKASNVGQMLVPDAQRPAYQRLMNPQVGDSERLIRGGERYGFRFDSEDPANTDTSGYLARFTDDVGLHWEIDHNLHLVHLSKRDW